MGQRQTTSEPTLTLVNDSLLQRQCTGGQHTGANSDSAACYNKPQVWQPGSHNQPERTAVPSSVAEVLRSPGRPLDSATCDFMEPRFGHDFSRVRVHDDPQAAASARSLSADAYTVGQDVVFGAGRYAPQTSQGKSLLAHELTHVVQQDGSRAIESAPVRVAAADSLQEQEADVTAEKIMDGRAPMAFTPATPAVHLRAAPYIKKVTVHLTPSQSADLEWEGTPPATATGTDHFQVSTGKGYGDPGDPPGTCTRNCCSDPSTQCAPPYNQPSRVGSCCTYYGSTFWTGTPEAEHNGWRFWTPIQPYYSSRGIALHQHTEVTGQPIGHGCVRMAEENAERIAEFSNGRRTNVTIDGRAAPVACEEDRRCRGSGSGSSTGRGTRLGPEGGREQLAEVESATPGLEGEMT